MTHPFLRRKAALTAAILIVVASCAPEAVPDSNPGGGVDVALPAFLSASIETDATGLCHGRDISPAVIETVTAQVQEREAILAEDGTVLAPASYRTSTTQSILREREEVLFETLCPPAYSAEFVASLQRALAARGYYLGPVSGVMDDATARAVQDYQRQSGPDSPLLAIDTARRLGLVALSESQIDLLN